MSAKKWPSGLEPNAGMLSSKKPPNIAGFSSSWLLKLVLNKLICDLNVFGFEIGLYGVNDLQRG